MAADAKTKLELTRTIVLIRENKNDVHSAAAQSELLDLDFHGLKGETLYPQPFSFYLHLKGRKWVVFKNNRVVI